MLSLKALKHPWVEHQRLLKDGTAVKIIAMNFGGGLPGTDWERRVKENIVGREGIVSSSTDTATIPVNQKFYQYDVRIEGIDEDGWSDEHAHSYWYFGKDEIVKI